MSPTNITFLTGNLTRDPDYRTSPSGIVVCRFSVAANSRYRDKAGVWQEGCLCSMRPVRQSSRQAPESENGRCVGCDRQAEIRDLGEGR